MKEATDCEIHIFDPTSEPLKGYNYHSLGLADHDGEVAMQTDASFAGQKFPVKTLQSIMKGLGHTYIDILKIDVDGWECGILEKMDWTGTIHLKLYAAGSFSALLRDFHRWDVCVLCIVPSAPPRSPCASQA